MTHPIRTRRAGFMPDSLDREARTFVATASTGASVQRKDARGPYDERLDLTKIDTASLIGVTILDAHRQGSHRDAIGVVQAARMEAGALVVSIKIARGAEGDAVLDKIEDGVLRGVSIGYRGLNPVETKGQRGERIRTLTPDIMEISLTPVPADRGATIRSNSMEDEAETMDRPEADDTSRAEVNRKIRLIAKVAGLMTEWSDTQIDAGASEEEARAAAFEEMRTRTPATVRANRSNPNDDAMTVRSMRGEALYARANPAHELSAPARRYAGDSMIDIARDCLTRSGTSITGLAAGELATRALHTTSDFPAILGDAVNRTLREAYTGAPSGLKQVARQTTARDFRDKHRVQLGEAPTLEKVPESGEFTRGTMGEGEETYRLETFGRIIGLSRQAIINDDLGAFASLSGRIGVAATSFEATQLAKLLEANAAMKDGNPVFHASHKNLADTAGALSETTLSAGRLAMRTQTGLSEDLIDVTPFALIVPPQLETTAEKLLSGIQAARTDDVNPFSKLMLIVEPRLTSATAWYIAANPTNVDGLEYAYLEGATGPQTETRQGFDVDGIEIKVRLDFGAGFVDWRSWYKNEGA